MSKRKETWVEEIEVAGNEAVARVKELIAEGNIRRLIVRKKNGEVIVELPLTASVVAGSAALVFTPFFAAISAVAAFLAEVRIEVVREGEKPKNDDLDDDDVPPPPPTKPNNKTRIDID